MRGVPTRTVVTIYPLVFWWLVFKIEETTQFIPAPVVTNAALNLAWRVYFYVGLFSLGAATLFALWVFLQFLRVYRSVPAKIPQIVGELLEHPSQNTALALKLQIKEVLVSTLTRGQMRVFETLSRMKTASRTGEKLAFFLNAAFLPGSFIVTVELVRVLRPIGRTLVPTTGYDISSPFALLTLMVGFSIVDFAHLLDEERSSSYKALRPSYFAPLRILVELTIGIRALTLLGETVQAIGFGKTLKTGEECPDEHTLSRIFESTLTTQIGPSVVFFYNFEDLYPPSELQVLSRLDKRIREFVHETHPVAFVGVYNNKCVLLAESDRLDVRRLDIWTSSPALTRNIVTKTERLILGEKDYEELE